MSQEFIQIAGLELATTTATERARQDRDALLARSKRGTIIISAEGAAKAAEILRDLKNFAGIIEAERKDAKERPLELGRKIDALAHELTDAVEDEAKRLSKILGTWQAEQDRLAAVERRKAWDKEQEIIRQANEEAARKKKEADDAQAALDAKAAADAKAAKEAADARQKELDDKLARTRSENGAAKVEAEKLRAEKEATAAAEALRLKNEADKAEADRKAKEAADAHQKKVEDEIAANRVAASAIVAQKPVGSSTRSKILFEVTDILLLYESCPALVTLTANDAAIRNALKQLPEDKVLPGVRHWREFGAVVRNAP